MLVMNILPPTTRHNWRNRRMPPRALAGMHSLGALIVAGMYALLATAASCALSTARAAPQMPLIPYRSPQVAPAAGSTPSRALAVDYGKLPMSFEANQGQSADPVKFLARASGYALFLTDEEAVLSFADGSPPSALRHAEHSSGNAPASRPEERQTVRSIRILRLKFKGGNTHAAMKGRGELAGKTNYIIGNDPKQWRTNIANYAGVEYRSLYPGVDLVFHGNQRDLEYDFIVAPGANPQAIALDVLGAKRMHIGPRGDLEIGVGQSRLELKKPVVYQEVAGKRREIAGNFAIRGAHGVGFALGPYDRSLPLIIDPTLIYSTYLGGGNVTAAANDTGKVIAVDASGDVYVAGSTGSNDFPVTAGAYETAFPDPGQFAGFVTKLNPSGSALIYSTYFAGASTGVLTVYGIAVDASGDVYLTGQTNYTFPTTAGAFIPTETDIYGSYGFVTELNPAGSGLVYSTFLSGTETTGSVSTYALGIALDGAGAAYVVGVTSSATYPTTAGAFQPQGCASACPGGAGFVTKLKPGGATLSYSTYLGTGGNKPWAVAVDSSGDAVVVGTTDAQTFPVTAGAFQTTSSDPVAVPFATELNPTGTALLYSTFISGTNSGSPDQAFAVAVDAAGDAYVTGQTGDSDFPTTPGAYQRSLLDYSDAFVTKLNPSGSALMYSTYLPGGTTGYSIKVNATGEAYVAGDNYGEDGTFPTTPGAFQASAPTTTTNGFLTVFNSAGSGLVYSTYIGVTSGNEITDAYALALDASGSAYLTGMAQPNFPTTAGAYKTTLAANANYPDPTNAFVMKFSFAGASLSISPTTLAAGTAGVAYGPITFAATGGQGTVTFSESGTLPTGMSFTNAVLSGTPTHTGNYPIEITATDAQNNTNSESLNLSINCPSIVVTPASLSNGTVGAAYGAVTFAQTGGLGTIAFSEAGALPSGMSFASGVLSGTPTQSGTFSIVVTAKDSNACTGSVSDSFTIAPIVVSTAPVATLSPTSLDFGEVISGTTSPPSAITLSNTGNAALDLTGSGISISGANAAEFSQSNGCGTSVAAGATCTINVTFTPGLTAGAESATLSVSDNAAGTPQQAALAAVVLPPASVSCTIPTINVTADSGTAQITCTATDFVGTIALDCNLPASLSAYVTCSFSPNSLVFTSSAEQATTTLSIEPLMTGSVHRRGAPGGPSAGIISLAALLWLPILSLGFRPSMGKSQRRLLLLLILFCGLQLVTACHTDSSGGNGTSTAPPGTYQASVVLTGPGLQSTTLTFSIQVQLTSLRAHLTRRLARWPADPFGATEQRSADRRAAGATRARLLATTFRRFAA